MAILTDIKEAVTKGKTKEIGALVQTALDEGADPQDIINNYLIDAMNEVGARFEANKIFVPEMMIAARTMQNGLAVIEPLIAGGEVKLEKLATAVIGTVLGDLHDIGKNLVVLMLESSGFDVIDIGVNVPVEKFVEKAGELKADVVGISSLLTTGDANMQATVAALKNSDLGKKVKIICGGAAVTEQHALNDWAADGYAQDAAGAVRVIKQLLKLE
ncbi:MAG: corrinoid protein [Desulfobacterales bacterium]|jgi:methanogenic corrinoid protein MtbC1